MICPKCSRDIPDDAVLCCYCGRVFQRRKPSSRAANGQGTAYKRGSTWTVRITAGWKTTDIKKKPTRIYKTKGGFPTKSAALAYAQELHNGVSNKVCPVLQHYWTIYERDNLPKLSSSKATAYKIAWGRLKPIANRKVSTITVDDLRQTVANACATYYPARDCKQLLAHLFTLAAADGWASKDLPSFIILPEREEKERQPFTAEEQAALWRSWESGNIDAALPLIMIYTGMMPGELMDLRPEMIDLEARKITGAGKKTKVRRESPVYIPLQLVPVFETALEHISPGGFVLFHSEPIFYRHYYDALAHAGIRHLEPYCCRHTTATALAIDRSIAPQTIQRIMRWSSTRMLDRYAHPDDHAVLTVLDGADGQCTNNAQTTGDQHGA